MLKQDGCLDTDPLGDHAHLLRIKGSQHGHELRESKRLAGMSQSRECLVLCEGEREGSGYSTVDSVVWLGRPLMMMVDTGSTPLEKDTPP